MNLPNKITLARILLIPFVIFFYLAEPFLVGGKMIATALFFVGVITDFFDGYLARKNNQVTVLGTFLDSIADKMFVTSALLLIVADGTIRAPFGVIFAIIIIAREFLVSALRQLGASKNIIISADYFGKIKATFQFVAIFMFMLYSGAVTGGMFASNVLEICYYICFAILCVTVVLTILSGVNYIIKNKSVFVEDTKKVEINENQDKIADSKSDDKKV